jgi:hypothetical protein
MLAQTMTEASKSIPTTARLSMPGILLRLEGLTVFLAAVIAYAQFGFSGLAFVLLLLVPDVAMIGYRVNPRVGAALYNAAHFYGLPALLLGLGWGLSTPLLVQGGLIWAAHIGMDRAVGYGFKYATAFKDTHMGRV